jgi:hypothetical protein
MFLTCFFYFSRYFHIFAKLLLTNFFAPFFGCIGIQFLILFLVPSGLRASTPYMLPHISGTECIGFSKQDARGNLVVD